MPVFFHPEIDELMSYVGSKQFFVYLIKNNGENAVLKEKEYIEEYFHRSNFYFGAYPEDYLLLSHFAIGVFANIKCDYDRIVEGKSGNIMLVGYNDGGIFSISHEILPFQSSIYEIKQWDFIKFLLSE